MDLEKIITSLENRTPTIADMQNFTKFAVLIPLIKIEDELHILFEVRALSLRRQPGEICLPGGKMDEEDENEQVTAVRETVEELGIPQELISIVAPLDFNISPYGTIIYPFVGYLSKPELIKPNPSEVEKVFTVPLSFFMMNPPDCFKVNFHAEPEESFPYSLIHGGEKYKWQPRKLNEYFYYYEEFVIWGLTAKLIKQFVEHLQK
ncbi:CoA pyrophosphatase [Bacillus sp. FJAT-49736]|uniref:NUDIX hydrolase n=1 Tax=Bacillus sp. FJAT-49736 TaxID=2833582 RepID=UPI001BC94584|nr:CoA pyrophosphatase [Bacillus sp. FJAT-49736]MBS4173528.1 CoA pyrophosphatase [Bacillus sp. FJAT-49736]MBS4175918.1 CoA pyrophosphatase [Bacillus sp. FJAT-49736]